MKKWVTLLFLLAVPSVASARVPETVSARAPAAPPVVSSAPVRPLNSVVGLLYRTSLVHQLSEHPLYADFSVYDPATNTWTQLSDYNTSAQMAVSSTGQLFAFGYDTHTIDLYDPASDAWSAFTSAPPGATGKWGNLKITNAGEFLYTEWGGGNLWYTAGGEWNTMTFPFSYNLMGDYDPTTNQYVIGEANTTNAHLIDLNTWAVTDYASALYNGEFARFGVLLDSKYFFEADGSNVHYFDLVSPALPPSDTGTKLSSYGYESAAADRANRSIYVASLDGSQLWVYDTVANTATPLAGNSFINLSSLAFTGVAEPAPTPTPVPVPGGIWYLPAGGTSVEGVDFDTYILVANSGAVAANIEIVYVGTGQVFGIINRTVPAGTRYTENMKTYMGAGKENVASIIRSTNDVPVIVERAMYFPGGAGSGAWTGSHNTIGLSTTGVDWFLAEGATHSFDQFVHILNPNAADSDVTVTFFNKDGDFWSETDTLGGRRVWTVKAEDVAGSQDQLSTRVTSSLPVAVDRTMYWPKGSWEDGHATIGVLDFANEWYLPEGATHIFNEYVLVANPNQTQSADVTFTFTDQGGGLWTHQANIPAQRRYTVNVNQIVGDVTQVSTKVTSSLPVVAERAMYCPKGSAAGWTGGHGTVGVSAPALSWHLPEGATHIFDEYVLVANPSATEAASVLFTFRDQFANTWTHNQVVPPQRRYTVKANDVVGYTTQLSTMITSSVPVVAERAMYLPTGGPWRTGHVTVGVGEE